MDILKRYWFWVGAGAILLVIVIVRFTIIKSYNDEYAKAIKQISKSSKQIAGKVKKAKNLPNQNMINQAKHTIEHLTEIKDDLNELLQKRNAPLDKYFGFSVGTLRDDLPDPVSFKESYGNEIRALVELLKKNPGFETGLSIDKEENTLTPGAFEFDANLYRDGKIQEENIPLTQKKFWIQELIVKALLGVKIYGVEIVPLEVLKKDKKPVLERLSAEDGSKINREYAEGLYKREYCIEKLLKLSVDNGLRYDIEKRFRLFKVTIKAEMQYSLVAKTLEALLAIEPMIVKIRDLQIVSTLGEKKSESKSELMNRYKEPAVEVTINLYGLDYLNAQERKHVSAMQEDN